jgi:hypothetical protein
MAVAEIRKELCDGGQGTGAWFHPAVREADPPGASPHPGNRSLMAKLIRAGEGRTVCSILKLRVWSMNVKEENFRKECSFC